MTVICTLLALCKTSARFEDSIRAKEKTGTHTCRNRQVGCCCTARVPSLRLPATLPGREWCRRATGSSRSARRSTFGIAPRPLPTHKVRDTPRNCANLSRLTRSTAPALWRDRKEEICNQGVGSRDARCSLLRRPAVGIAAAFGKLSVRVDEAQAWQILHTEMDPRHCLARRWHTAVK